LHNESDVLRRYALLVYERVFGQRGHILYLVNEKRTERRGRKEGSAGFILATRRVKTDILLLPRTATRTMTNLNNFTG
jgi:hypothetical protein